MEFDAGRGKGILDKSFPSIKIPVHKDCSYTDLRNQCIECVWGESSDEYSYYIADGSGTAIGSGCFLVTLPGGGSMDPYKLLISVSSQVCVKAAVVLCSKVGIW